MSPIAFHFTSALFVSSIALIHRTSRMTLGLLVGLKRRRGRGLRAFVLSRVFTDNIGDAADRVCYGVCRCSPIWRGLWRPG